MPEVGVILNKLANGVFLKHIAFEKNQCINCALTIAKYFYLKMAENLNSK